MGICNYPGCKNTRQGCFRPNCRFAPSREYTAWDAFNEMRLAIKDAEYVFENEPIAKDAIEYIKQRLMQIQQAE